MNLKNSVRYWLACIFTVTANTVFPAGSYGQSTLDTDKIEEYIARGMEDWGIPGLAISIVKEGEIIYQNGFGVRKLEETCRVDENTVFGVASTTKAMTATALGMLVDEGRISWDDRVRDHLPWFELSDPWVSDVVTIRDLLTHRVGLGRITGNRLRFMPDRERRTILKYISNQPFEIPFRSGFVYSNMMYMVAGLIIEEVTGVSWDEFLPEMLFKPLNMKSASVSVNSIGDNENAAWPHQEIDGTVQTIPRRNFDNVGPAASVNASAGDMAQWMLFNLGKPGEYKGTQIISTEVMYDIFQPNYPFPVRDPMKDSFNAYTLGWNTGHYNSLRVFQHGGATDGINSLIYLVPEIDLGVFVAGNLFCRFRPALVNYIVDSFTGTERDMDWHQVYLEQHLKNKEAALSGKMEVDNSRKQGTSPTLPIESYAGKFHNDLYDNLEVKFGCNGTLELHFWDDPEMVACLEHWHYDTFLASWKNPAMLKKFVNFSIGPEGKANKLNVNFTLRPAMIEVGLYPAGYTRQVEYLRISE